MDNLLAENIRSELTGNQYQMRADRTEQWLQKGVCPQCQKKSLYAPFQAPWWVRCNHINHCGYDDAVKELLEHLFEDWGKRYPPTPVNPTATADAYLTNMRAFDISKIKGWYTQENYYDPTSKLGSSTVRFTLSNGNHWDGLVDNRDQLKKSRLQPYSGAWWCPPGMVINQGDTIWIVEGIYDAISLWLEKGIKAIASLSSNNYPGTELAKHKDKEVTWIWALDADKAGSRAIIKYVDRMLEDGFDSEKVKAAQLPSKDRDWNDLFINGQLDDKAIYQSLYQGDLLLAKNPSAKARIMWSKYSRNTFSFVFGHKVYWFSLDFDKYKDALDELEIAASDENEKDEQINEALRRADSVKEICSAEPKVLYYQYNEVTDEAWYFARAYFPNGHTHDLTFSSSQLASASDFKKRLLTAPNARWKGTTGQMESYLEMSVQSAIKIVKAIDFIGYDITSGIYVFNNFAVHNGRVIKPNDENYFQTGKLSIKSTSRALSLNVNFEANNYKPQWAQKMWQSWGAEGMIAMTHFFGSLFVQQIRLGETSYPFLELSGEPGAGKSSLIEFIWKLFGRANYEGFNPSKATYSGLSRNFLQTGNLPVVLSEGDVNKEGAKKGQFNFDLTKDCYEGRGFISRGLKNGGNETYEPPFKGALVFSQNHPVQAQEAVLQRIVRINFNRSNHNAQSREAVRWLKSVPIEEVSHFLIMALQYETTLLKDLDDLVQKFETEYYANPKLKIQRLALNFGQLKALFMHFSKLVGLSPSQIDETVEKLDGMVLERQTQLEDDHPVVQEFWELVQYLESEKTLGVSSPTVFNHSKQKGMIAINFNQIVREASFMNQRLPAEMSEIKKLLIDSKQFKFQRKNVSLNSRVTGKTTRCWVFKGSLTYEDPING